MDILEITGTDDTPKVIFDQKNGLFEISGRSLPEDSVEFFKPVLDWIERYSKNPNPTNEFVFKMDYINTASSKLVQDIIESLESVRNAKVIWYSRKDDEDLAEFGQELSESSNIPFEFKHF